MSGPAEAQIWRLWDAVGFKGWTRVQIVNGTRRQNLKALSMTDAVAAVLAAADEHTNVHLGVNGRDESGEVVTQDVLPLDLDIKPGVLSNLEQAHGVVAAVTADLGVGPAAVVETGGGLHADWAVADDQRDLSVIGRERAAADAELLWAIARRHAPIDKIADLARVLRAPGTRNPKHDGAPLVTLVATDPAARLDRLALREVAERLGVGAPPPQARQPKPISVDSTGGTGDVLHRLFATDPEALLDLLGLPVVRRLRGGSVEWRRDGSKNPASGNVLDGVLVCWTEAHDRLVGQQRYNATQLIAAMSGLSPAEVWAWAEGETCPDWLPTTWHRVVRDARAQAQAECSQANSTQGQMAEMVEAIREVGLQADPAAAVAATDEDHRRFKLTWASEIPPKPVHWLWKYRLPMNALTLFAGRPSIGKSTIAYWMVAQVTHGRFEGECAGRPRNVIVAATEDSWEHVIVPRLIAAGADLGRVARVEVETVHGLRELSLPIDIAALAEAIRENDVAMLLLDPLMSRIGKSLDTHKDAEVRLALEPLVRMADETDISMVGLMHFNKAEGPDPLARLMGSLAFVAVARMVLAALDDPDDDDEKRRALSIIKSNGGPEDIPSLMYHVVGHNIDHPEGVIETSRIEWDGEDARSGRMLMAAAQTRHQKATVKGNVKEWMLDWFERHAEGHAIRADVIAAGQEMRFAVKTIDRAKAALQSEGLIGSHTRPAQPGVWFDTTRWQVQDGTLVRVVPGQGA